MEEDCEKIFVHSIEDTDFENEDEDEGRGYIKMWDTKTGKLIKTLQGFDEQINTIVITKDKKRIISAPWIMNMEENETTDNNMVIWDTKTGEFIKTFKEGHRDGISSLVISADGKTLVSGSADGYMKVWDVKTGKLLWSL